MGQCISSRKYCRFDFEMGIENNLWYTLFQIIKVYYVSLMYNRTMADRRQHFKENLLKYLISIIIKIIEFCKKNNREHIWGFRL